MILRRELKPWPRGDCPTLKEIDLSDAVTYETICEVAIITLNRPDRINRIDAAVVDGLHYA